MESLFWNVTVVPTVTINDADWKPAAVMVTVVVWTLALLFWPVVNVPVVELLLTVAVLVLMFVGLVFVVLVFLEEQAAPKTVTALLTMIREIMVLRIGLVVNICYYVVS